FLVVIGSRDVLAQAQGPLIWHLVSHEQAQEGTFPGPIWPHQANFFTTVDGAGEAAQHRALTVRLPDLAPDNDLVALALMGGKAQLHALIIRRGFLHPLQTLQPLLTALRLVCVLPGHVPPDKLLLTSDLGLLEFVGFALLFEARKLGRHIS